MEKCLVTEAVVLVYSVVLVVEGWKALPTQAFAASVATTRETLNSKMKEDHPLLEGHDQISSWWHKLSLGRP